jgi:hypothetical protein
MFDSYQSPQLQYLPEPVCSRRVLPISIHYSSAVRSMSASSSVVTRHWPPGGSKRQPTNTRCGIRTLAPSDLSLDSMAGERLRPVLCASKAKATRFFRPEASYRLTVQYRFQINSAGSWTLGGETALYRRGSACVGPPGLRDRCGIMRKPESKSTSSSAMETTRESPCRDLPGIS